MDFGYAVPLDRLLRVVDCGFCFPLPLVPSVMAGILILDDELIPLLDSSWLPDVIAGRSLNVEFKVLISTEYGPVALPADTAVGIVAEDRCKRVSVGQEVVNFFVDSVAYRNKCYRVLDADMLIVSLIRP